jgi:hypothetical protein
LLFCFSLISTPEPSCWENNSPRQPSIKYLKVCLCFWFSSLLMLLYSFIGSFQNFCHWRAFDRWVSSGSHCKIWSCSNHCAKSEWNSHSLR